MYQFGRQIGCGRQLQGGDYGRSSAVGLFQSLVGLVLVTGTNMIVKRISPEN